MKNSFSKPNLLFKSCMTCGLALAIDSITLSPAEALFVNPPTNATELLPPASFVQGANEADDRVFFIREGINSLNNSLFVDLSFPTNLGAATQFDGSAPPPGSSATLAAGINVSSVLIQFDPVNPTGASTTLATNPVFTFLFPIIGIQNDLSSLNSGDSELGLANITYASGEQIGSADLFTISADRRTLTINNLIATGAGVDRFRVINAVPEPLTILGSLTGLGFGALFKKKLSSRNKFKQD